MWKTFKDRKALKGFQGYVQKATFLQNAKMAPAKNAKKVAFWKEVFFWP